MKTIALKDNDCFYSAHIKVFDTVLHIEIFNTVFIMPL